LAGPQRCHLDQQKLKQILYNLLANASNSPTMAARWNPGRDARCALLQDGGQDTGIVSNPNLQRLFKDFEQLESGGSRRYEGTGLGLALTRKIVEARWHNRRGSEVAKAPASRSNCTGHRRSHCLNCPNTVGDDGAARRQLIRNSMGAETGCNRQPCGIQWESSSKIGYLNRANNRGFTYA